MTGFHDRFGNPLAVGDRVHADVIDDGAPAYASRGTVVGFGRIRVKVEWDAISYTLPTPRAPHTPHPCVLRRVDR